MILRPKYKSITVNRNFKMRKITSFGVAVIIS
jgi:hypothetical protein